MQLFICRVNYFYLLIIKFAIGVAYIAWNPDSTHLLACGPEGSPEVWLWNIETEKCLKISQSPEDVLTCAAWNKDGTKFVVSVNILHNFQQG